MGVELTGSQQRTQMVADQRKRAAARQVAHENYNRQVDAATERYNKSVDSAAAQAKGKGSTATAIGDALAHRVDTSRGGNYNEMSTGQIFGDAARRVAGKVANAVISDAETTARGVYHGYKRAEGAVVDTAASGAKFISNATGGAQKAIDSAGTTIENAVDTAKTYAKRVSNWFSHAAKNISHLGD